MMGRGALRGVAWRVAGCTGRACVQGGRAWRRIVGIVTIAYTVTITRLHATKNRPPRR